MQTQQNVTILNALKAQIKALTNEAKLNAQELNYDEAAGLLHALILKDTPSFAQTADAFNDFNEEFMFSEHNEGNECLTHLFAEYDDANKLYKEELAARRKLAS